MPCNSDYLFPDGHEVAISRVACLLGELAGRPWTRDAWRGFHPEIYNIPYDGDSLVAELCSKLSAVDVTQYSLEMQMWWRDHKAADKARIERELADMAAEVDRQAALEKLTPYERELLRV